MGAYSTDNGSPSDNPAVFETYPKEDIGLDIYYEIGRAYPITLAKDNDETLMLLHGRILSLNGAKPEDDIWITDFRFEDEDNATRPCKLIASEDINNLFEDGFSSGDIVVVEDGWGGEISLEVSGSSVDNYFFVQPNVHNATIKLPWHNCYTFGNGIESDRIRDDFNAPTQQNGVKASKTLAEQYKEEKELKKEIEEEALEKKRCTNIKIDQEGVESCIDELDWKKVDEEAEKIITPKEKPDTEGTTNDENNETVDNYTRTK